ncbi:UDP-N-acetyl-D-mannosamine dehydrogenase [Ulvibacter litoralis]|uniref:UDP-N-acetyl-D-mannosaminuronic acid dehydrogenase n=1 Tax=Ulvibacter litoralis TaxID=227084 RepID=A0A1G7D8L7_9FLAO|nr:UDP-N-acetyl-D-mannosamine dehydrogenase [Ulvibacter litoralis]SDE47978.1 UDP-N-acetyl-D-mannosaminuronic acid dehydrogenase [Ulvibacter litoralis]
MESKPSVVLMGLGYIGLPTAALIASRGIYVTGVDINQQVVDTINKGKIHIVEPELDGLVHHVVKEGYLKASTVLVEADVYLIAVPTPFKGDYVPDLSYVMSAVSKIIPTLKTGALVILESTSPVGTTQKVQELIFEARPDLKDKIFIAYCPERVLPGNVIYELEQNDRAIGGIDEASTEKAVRFYKFFVKGELHKTNSQTAEMCKLVENSSRDVQIAFANELSMICDKANINVWELIRLANKHPRVNVLQPGTGVGGHCIAVDPWFIVSEFPEEAKIIRLAREINNYKTDWAVEKVKNTALQFKIDTGRNATIACMGLAFKPNIDDLRESPALHVSDALQKDGFLTLEVEPNLTNEPSRKLTPFDEAIEKADIIVFLVAHSEFKNLVIEENKIILDFCGIK